MSTKYFGGMDLSQIGTLTATALVAVGLISGASLFISGDGTFNGTVSANQYVATGTATAIFSDGDIKMFDSNNTNSSSTYRFNVDDETFLSVQRAGSAPGYFEPFTIFTVDAPNVTNPVESTITARVTTSTAFHLWDTYNEFYPTESQVGWRLVSRGTGGTSTGSMYRDIVLDRQIGTAASAKEPLIVVTSSTDPFFGFGVRVPTAKFDFEGGEMLLNSAGTASLEVSRAANTNFGLMSFQTNKTSKWDLGMRNDATDNLQVFDQTTATTSLKFIGSNTTAIFNTSTYWNAGGPVVRDASNGNCYRLGTAAGVVTSTQIACQAL